MTMLPHEETYSSRLYLKLPSRNTQATYCLAAHSLTLAYSRFLSVSSLGIAESPVSYHTPLHRQSAILERDIGLEITRATMCGWVMTVGEMLSPVVGAMRRELLASGYLQADETPIDVQTHDGRGKNHQAYLWQYGRRAVGWSSIFA